jgi:homoserine O-succinyltransferase
MADDRMLPLGLGRGLGGERPITIGLVNNMPDAALAATEAQFRRLIAGAAGGRDVRLALFALPGVPRSEAARAAMGRRYASTHSLSSSSVDALIVTGAEPLAGDLKDEPFWGDMADLVDWAQANTVSTLYSCLAAHAAALHLDGVRRRPLPAKCSGVFAVEAAPHPLTADQDDPLLTPHSRWNGLDAGELEARGYAVLTRSDEIGVDAFVREGQSLLVGLQGHPEYEAETLMLEYRRDVRRFLIGERAGHPAVPSGYFAPDIEQALIDLAVETVRRPTMHALSEGAKIMRGAEPPARWRRTTEQLYRNWVGLIAERVGRRVTA